VYKRELEIYLDTIKQKYKATTIVGPRQSGKTTLVKKYFCNYKYISLESLDNRARAIDDPKGFLKSLKTDTILDEIQNAPEIFSYIQEILDDPDDSRKFIFTGSNSLQLSNKISQSLAGRTRILKLLPLSYAELPQTEKSSTVWEAIFKGMYPRIYNEKLNPTEWYGDYYQTYVEKDVRNLLNIDNLQSFDRYLRLLAGRVGQLVNHSSIASDSGITSPTAASWNSVLNASFITFELSPHFKNFSKRIIKAPKIYFFDTGLLCYLLRITDPIQLEQHPLRGQIFENWIISEAYKYYFNSGKEAPLYFWRDKHGHEVDLVIDRGTKLDLYEIKSSATFKKEFLNNLSWLSKLQGAVEGTLIYSGDDSFNYKTFSIESWKNFTVSLGHL
jgi:predicted AAA+ superfamily ATPase